MARTRTLVNSANPNGIEVPFTAAEETQADTDASEAIVRKQAEADAKVAQEATDAQTATDKASARVKLKAEEYTPLTEAEADAITI